MKHQGALVSTPDYGTGSQDCYETSGSSLFRDRLHRRLVRHRLQPTESGDRTGKGDRGVFAVGAQQVIGDEQLRKSQWITMAHFRAVVVITELVGAQRAQIGQMLPDRFFQFCGMFPAYAAFHVKKLHWTSTVAPELKANPRSLAALMVRQISEVGMRNRRAQDQMNVQMRVRRIRCDGAIRIEAHDNVSKFALGTNEVS